MCGNANGGVVSSLLPLVHRQLCTLLFGCVLAFSCAASERAAELEAWRPEAVPPLDLPTLEGRAAALAAEAGKLVIVHFFATWCEPCRDELRSLERLAETLDGRPFRILAVDVGEPADRIRRFLARNEISLRFPVLIDFDKQSMWAWDVEMLPTSYVLDRALCPLWKVAGALEWDVGPILSKLEIEVARIERGPSEGRQENCMVKGGSQ